MANETGSHSENANFHPDAEDMAISERAERLQKAVQLAGGNTKVAIRAQMPLSTLSRYLGGRDMKASAMIALARACDVSLDWLADGTGNIQSDAAIPNLNTSLDNVEPSVPVKYFKAEPSAGTGCVPEEWDGGEVFHVSKEFLNNILGVYHRSLFFVRVQGDSMMPTLNPGDTILVDYTPEQIMESVYVVSVQGMLMVKRLSVKDALTFSLVSDNERYKPFDIQMARTSWANASTDADLRIIGRVVGRFHINL